MQPESQCTRTVDANRRGDGEHQRRQGQYELDSCDDHLSGDSAAPRGDGEQQSSVWLRQMARRGGGWICRTLAFLGRGYLRSVA